MDKDEVKRQLFEHQTLDVLCCFFDESYLETDGPSKSSDFDPINIAKQLRDLGDHYDATVIQPLMHDVQKARTDQVAGLFTNSVQCLCKTWVAERPEIVPEKHLLKATMTLSLYMKDNYPDMKELVRGAILNILNNQLGSWIMQQGGWLGKDESFVEYFRQALPRSLEGFNLPCIWSLSLAPYDEKKKYTKCHRFRRKVSL